MDLDELQSVQSRERQTDSLQQLRESFYAEASEFVQQLRDARDDAAERADDPWDNPEVSQLTDEIDTAEQTIEAIYDRRTGKIVKKASLAAAGMPTEEEGLTAEERALFESLVEQIEDNREHVLDKVAGDIAPESSPVDTESSTSPTAGAADPDPEPAPPETDPPDTATDAPDSTDAGVSAADLMGDGAEDGSPDPAPPEDDTANETPPPPPPEALAEEPSPETPADDERPSAPDPAADGGATRAAGDGASAAAGNESTPAADDEPTETVDRTTVRITDDVGPIYCVDEREYDLSRNDVVTLPEENAGPLVENGAAEQFD